MNIIGSKIMSNKIFPSVKFVIYGETASKSNSRKIVNFGKRFGIIKSEKARKYVKSFAEQCPTLENLIELDVKVELKIYVNDRQVKEKHIFWGLDREQPRTHVRVTPLEVCRLPSDF